MGTTPHQFKLGDEVEMPDDAFLIDGSTVLSAEHIGKILFVTVTAILTYPTGGIPGFRANIMCASTGHATLEGDAGDLDLASGQIIEAGNAVTLFKRPDDGRLIGYGAFTE